MDIEHIDSGIASGAAPPADECRSIGPTRAWANLWFVTWLSTATGGGFFGVVMAAHTHRPSELLLFIVFFSSSRLLGRWWFRRSVPFGGLSNCPNSHVRSRVSPAPQPDSLAHGQQFLHGAQW